MRFLSRAGAGLLVFLLALPIVGCSSGSSGGGSSANALLNAARASMIPGSGSPGPSAALGPDDPGPGRPGPGPDPGPGPAPGGVEILGSLPVNRNIVFSVVQFPISATPSTSSEGTTMGFGRMQGLAPGQSISYQYEYFAPEAGVVGIGFRFGPGGSIWMLPQPGRSTLLDGSLALDLELPADTDVCEKMAGRCGTYELYAFAVVEDPVTGARQISDPAIVSGALFCDPDAFEPEGCRPGDLDCAMCSEPSCQDLIAACNTNVIVQTIVTEETEHSGDERGCFSGLIEHTIYNAPPESNFSVESTWNATASGSIGEDGTLTLELPTPLHCPCLEGTVEFFLDGVLIGTTSEFGAEFLICSDV